MSHGGLKRWQGELRQLDILTRLKADDVDVYDDDVDADGDNVDDPY